MRTLVLARATAHSLPNTCSTWPVNPVTSQRSDWTQRAILKAADGNAPPSTSPTTTASSSSSSSKKPLLLPAGHTPLTADNEFSISVKVLPNASILPDPNMYATTSTNYGAAYNKKKTAKTDAPALPTCLDKVLTSRKAYSDELTKLNARIADKLGDPDQDIHYLPPGNSNTNNLAGLDDPNYGADKLAFAPPNAAGYITTTTNRATGAVTKRPLSGRSKRLILGKGNVGGNSFTWSDNYTSSNSLNYQPPASHELADAVKKDYRMKFLGYGEFTRENDRPYMKLGLRPSLRRAADYVEKKPAAEK
jgi:hypothetical protein